MRKKKFIAMALVAMLSLSGLTGCSDKDKADISNKLNNKTTETTKKDDSKADDKTSESKSDNKSDNKKSDSNSSSDKPANKPSSGNNGSASKPNSNNSSANKPSSGNTGSASKPSNGNSGNNASKPHEHTWVDHTATKQVPRTVHHDAVYEDVTIPAVTQTQEQCLGCKQWFSSLDDIVNHAMKVKMGMEAGDPQRCGSVGGVEREVVITPAHTEHRLVKEAWDETVYDTQTYVDYQECSGCHEHRQK